MRVLEIGGGNGFQAAVLASWGCEITSIDVETDGRWTRQYFPVSTYDGIHLPFETGRFDIVFSSNVLEHVTELKRFLVETARVMRATGHAIHVLPSPAWRLWTMLTHYPYLVKRALIGRSEDVGLSLRATGVAGSSMSILRLARKVMVPGAHGEFRSSFDELFQYRDDAWRKRFADAGLDVQESFPTGIFYTGNAICPALSLQSRRAASRLFGSACNAFVLRHGTAFTNERSTV